MDDRDLEERGIVRTAEKQLGEQRDDPHTGRQLGTFAQAFSHLALINALMHLIREDERLVAMTAITSDLDPEPLASKPAPLMLVSRDR